MFIQNITDASFLINEVQYLASPYYDLEGIAKSLVFLFSYLCSVLMIWVCVFSKTSKLWVGILVVIFLAVWSDLFIQIAVSSRGFTKAEYATALLNASDFDNMLAFTSEIIQALFYTLLFISVLVVLRKKILLRLRSFTVLLIILSTFSIVYGAKQWVYYIQYPSYPAVIKMPLIAGSYHANMAEIKPRVLDENIKPNQLSAADKNIIWIIDESIGGGYLSLNGFKKETTPFLKSIANTKLSNYGIVNSVANCSAISNLMLRVGLSSHTKGVGSDFSTKKYTLPTIFQFAKRAGYKTWLFDAQADEGQLQNFLTPYDMQSIDGFRTLNTRTEDYLRDRHLLDEIAKLLDTGGNQKNFIIFVKDGAHWPYLWRYPKEEVFFKPTQDGIYEEKTVERKQELINTYSNVVKYAVDGFFKEYVEKVGFKRALMIYTSDHGQNLLDQGSNTALTHCSTDYAMPVSQAEVPLFILGDDVSSRFPVRKDRLYSQYQIFPTVLSLMGYDKQTTSNYGETLFEGQLLSAKRWFYFGYDGDKVAFEKRNKPNMDMSGWFEGVRKGDKSFPDKI